MTQTEASYHRMPDEVPPPSGCPVNGFTPFAPGNIIFRGPRQLLVAWDE